MLPLLGRKALAEFLGTAGLACAVVGSGIAAERLSPGDAGVQLLENSVATSLALVALLLAFGSVSGAHLNPVVTGVEWGRRRMPGLEAGAYVLAQVSGGVAGALLANAMFGRPVFETAAHVRTGPALWLGEVVATAGLLLTIHGTAASNPRAMPLAVASYIGAAYWFTSSTSFANPAVTIARTLSDSFSGIAPSSLAAFVVAEVAGAAGACLILALLVEGWARPESPASGFAGRVHRSGAGSAGKSEASRPRILFVCVQNAGRSQMAAAFATALGRGRVDVLSAGSAPAGAIHRNVFDAMKEAGIDLAGAFPKPLTDAFVRASDAVVTMGCGDACPVFPGKRYEDWQVPDPAGQPLERVREIRDEIRTRVAALLDVLGVEPRSSLPR